MNKYQYLSVLQGDYGQGFEDLTQGSYEDCRRDLKDYRENEGGHYRIINRRVLNT